MGTVTAGNARLLFIIDNDYGELTMAMFFLHGQEIAARALLLLPTRLYATNASSLPVRTSQYNSYTDIVRKVEEERPYVVLLFSGYLLAVHGLLSTDSIRDLVYFIKSRGSKVVTYDPFWGLMSTPQNLFAAHYLQYGGPVWLINLGLYARARLSRMFKMLVETAEILRDLVHVNPAPIETELVPTAHFFNPKLISSQLKGITNSVDKPYWLFILSREDYSKQEIRHGRPVFPFFPPTGGRDRFAEITAGTLRQTSKAGRRSVILAPDAFIEDLRKHVSGTDFEFVQFCPYEQFLTLLVEAEYVFYWNAISSSSLLRLINERPIFYFDRGHIADGLEPVYQVTLQLYYRGWDPIYLDQQKELKPDELANLAIDFQRATWRIRENLLKSPTPDQMVEQILDASRATQ